MGKAKGPQESRLQERPAQETSGSSAANDRPLFQRNLAGLYRSAAAGKILECNDAFARILGDVSPEEAMAQPASVFYRKPDAREAMLARPRLSGSLSNFETRLNRKDGSEVWVLETVAPPDHFKVS